MKKLLLSSIVLFVFSLSILVFQISCKKEVNAQTTATDGLKQLGKIVYLADKGNGSAYYLMNYDGTGKQKLNISLPVGETELGENVKLSPDGKKVFFGGGRSLYSCNIDGTDLKKIVDASEGIEPESFSAY